MRILLGVVLSTVANLALGQSWTQLGAGVAYSYVHAARDGSSDLVYALSSGGFKRFDGVAWTQLPFLASAVGPMEFDAARGMLVLNGYSPANARFETWEWSGGQWAISPPATESVSALCFHRGVQKIVGLTR